MAGPTMTGWSPGELRCSKCGGYYVAGFFRLQGRSNGEASALASFRRPICIGCELTARTEAKVRDRPREKARRALDSHTARFLHRGVITDRVELRSVYGWDVDRMAHDISH